MVNVKLGSNIYPGVTAVKMDTTDGGTVLFKDNPIVTAIDYSGFAGGNFTATFSDGMTDPYGVQFNTEGRPIKVTRSDGSVVTVEWGES